MSGCSQAPHQLSGMTGSSGEGRARSDVGVRPVKGRRGRVGAAQREAGWGEHAAAFSRKT